MWDQRKLGGEASLQLYLQQRVCQEVRGQSWERGQRESYLALNTDCSTCLEFCAFSLSSPGKLINVKPIPIRWAKAGLLMFKKENRLSFCWLKDGKITLKYHQNDVIYDVHQSEPPLNSLHNSKCAIKWSVLQKKKEEKKNVRFRIAYCRGSPAVELKDFHFY